MSRENVKGLIIGFLLSLILAALGGGFAMAFDTREKVAVAHSRLDGQAEDIKEIKADVKELLKRTKP